MGELAVKIKGQSFQFFNDFELNLKYNAIASTFSVSGVIDEMDENKKKLFRPLSFNDVDVFYDGIKLITGTSIGWSTSAENKQTAATLSGYAKTGVIEDCEIPLSEYPLQFDNLTLKEIIEKLIKPFNLKLIIDDNVTSLANKTYEQTTAKENQTIKNYLSTLCSQRGIILTHDNSGNLLLTKPKVTQKSIATYREGVPSTKISLNVMGQRLHSKISVLRQSSFDVDVGGESTITNDLITKFRPTLREQTSGQNDETESFAKTIRGSELREIKLAVETDRWKWYDGKKLHLILPNNIIDVISPSNFIENRKSFFVEEVSIKGTPEGETAIINCVLPECYNLNQPKSFLS